MNSSELRGFLTGLILGDGSIDKGTTKRAFSIKSINKDFIDMIEDQIKSCSGFKTIIRYTPSHYSSGCNHQGNWELIIPAHPYFNKMYHHFYDDYRKRKLSNQALKWLTPAGLANWYMSDGYVCLVGKTKGVIKNRRVDICTDRYSLEDIHKIQKMLLDNYNIHTSVVKRENSYRIRILCKSYNTFFGLIADYIVPSMMYKLNLAYDYQPKWMSDELWEIQESLKSANPLCECA